MRPLLIRGGRVIDPRNGVDGPRDVLLRDGAVAEVGEKVSDPAAEVLDAAGKWVVPGLIDVHVHLREPGEEGKETVLSGSRAAVAGGFTAVVAMPNTRPPNDSPQVTELVLARARAADLCRVYPAGAISKGLLGEELSEMGELLAAGCVCFTDDGRPVMSAGLMRRALLYARPLGVPVMAHEEDLTLSGHGVMNEGPTAARLGLLPVPRSAEVAMVARDLVLAEEVDGRLHLAHVSCAESVALVREARRRGVRVTCEATPHHFTLTDEAVDGYRTEAKMNPPLRRPEDVAALRQGLADGTIDCIATDHAPHGPLDKELEFDRAANGVVGLETAVPLALELVGAGALSPSRAVALLTDGPARAFGLPGGHLGKGAAADVTVIDPSAEWVVDAERFRSRCRNTPFHGRKVRGRVTHTVVGGRAVFEEAQR
ncbi:MAG TPA: dihydroorotase [Myxococcales bacterium]|nr:dihydroorotase [Myxococcales bacterium]